MKYDIASLKRKMLVKYPFFGSVVTNVSYKENKDIPTAATDGKTIYYNPEFLNGLSVEEQTFIFAHEVCHIAFNHILRSDGKDPQLWNIATDAVINSFLKRDGLKIVEGGVDMAEAINYDAEQLYEKLLKEKQQHQEQNHNGNGQQNEASSQSQNQSRNASGNSEQQNSQSKQDQSGESNGDEKENSQGQQNSSSSGNGEKNDSKEQSSRGSGSSFEEKDSSKEDVGHDTHALWKDAVKKQKEEQSQGKDKKESIFDKLFNKESKEQEKSEVEKKQEEAEALGEKEAFDKNALEKKQQLQELREAIAKEASKAGTSTNKDIRTVNNIGSSKPLVDWRYFLREAIQYDVDWSYKNASIEDGVVNANLEEQPMPETEIVLDTSGSINEELLKNFLRECKNILLQSRVKVGCFDTLFYGFHDIRTEEDIETMEFVGGGGTNFDVAVNAFTKRVENKIIFTDGEADMPKMPIDAIWVVIGNEKINPKGGKVIYIDKEALSKLYFDYNADYNQNNCIRR